MMQARTKQILALIAAVVVVAAAGLAGVVAYLVGKAEPALPTITAFAHGLPRAGKELRSLAVSADGRLVVAGGDDGTVRVSAVDRSGCPIPGVLRELSAPPEGSPRGILSVR